MALTDKEIKALLPEKTRKKYFDGNGLYIEVDPSGSKWWRLKYRFNGKEKRISLGVYPKVSLKEAREVSKKMKEDLKAGIDPASRMKREGSKEKTFEKVAEEWLAKQSRLWTPLIARK